MTRVSRLGINRIGKYSSLFDIDYCFIDMVAIEMDSREAHIALETRHFRFSI